MVDAGHTEVHARSLVGGADEANGSTNSEEALAGLFDSPSRFRFRPPHRLTFGFRLVPPGRASSYLRSVLGARGNLERSDHSDKAVNGAPARKKALFATNDFSTYPQSLWDRLWMRERVDRSFSNLT